MWHALLTLPAPLSHTSALPNRPDASDLPTGDLSYPPFEIWREYRFTSKPKMTDDPLMMIGRLIRLGFCIIRSIASFFDCGSGRSLKTGLRVLTKSRKRSASMCFSRNSRVGGSRLISTSRTSTPALARKLLAFLHVVQVGFR